MRKFVLLLAMSCLPVLRAESQSVTLTGTGQLQSASVNLFSAFVAGDVFFSAVLPTTPTPDVANPTLFELLNVTFSFTQGTTTIDKSGTFRAYSSSGDGGFRFSVNNDLFLDVLGSGSPREQIFSGTTAAPTFNVGAYLAAVPIGAIHPREFRIAATVPEPSALLLMLTGVGALAVVARRRRQA